jgi:serine/threonine protein kinase
MPADLTGQTVAGYPLERLVATDSYGEFYEARTSAESIIVKVLRENLRSDPAMVQAVADGWQKAHTVTHPNLLAVLGAGIDPQHGAYVLQESLHTRSLRQLVLDGVCLNWRDILEFAIQMASALKTLHEAGLTHGDLSPFHILTTFDGEVRIEGSGGLVRATRALPQWMPPQALSYFAPERLRGGESSVAADLYSLGACIYFAIAGHDPFSGHNADSVTKAVLEVIPAPPKQMRGDVPREGLAVLGLLLEKNPGHRYKAVDDLLEHLTSLKDGRPLRLMRRSSPVMDRPTHEQIEAAKVAERPTPPAEPPVEVRTSAAAAIHSLRVQVEATVPRSEREKDGDYFYRTDRPELARQYWQEAWDAGVRHPGLKQKLAMLEPEVKRAQFAALMGEARLAFASGSFKACQRCAHQALDFADGEASRNEAAQLEAQAASQTGSFLGLNRSATTGLLLLSLASWFELVFLSLP